MPEPSGQTAPAAVWRSESSVDPSWAAPARTAAPLDPETTPQSGRRRWLWLTPVVVIVAVIAVVAALGGFGVRTDRLVTVPVGATVSTGPFDYTFTRATAQQQDDLGKTIVKVIVYGTAQNTTDQSRSPQWEQFVARDATNTEVQDADGLRLGTSDDYTVGGTLTPGLPPVTLRVEFSFDAGWRSSGTLRIGAANMTEQTMFLGQKQATPDWVTDADRIYQVRVPIRVLPPQVG